MSHPAYTATACTCKEVQKCSILLPQPQSQACGVRSSQFAKPRWFSSKFQSIDQASRESARGERAGDQLPLGVDGDFRVAFDAVESTHFAARSEFNTAKDSVDVASKERFLPPLREQKVLAQAERVLHKGTVCECTGLFPTKVVWRKTRSCF